MSSLLPLALVLGLLWCGLAQTEPIAGRAAEPIPATATRLQRLLRRTGQDYEVDIRITSRGSDQGSPSGVRLIASRKASPTGDRLRFRLEEGEGSHRYCLDCTRAGRARPCPGSPEERIPPGSEPLAGTLLPWEELLVGACGTWEVTALPNPPGSGSGLPPRYEVRLSPSPVGLSWARTLAEVDPASGKPIRFDRLDRSGRVVRSVKVLEVGAVADWEGIRRALVELPDGKVLMEIRGVRLGGAAFDPMAD